MTSFCISGTNFLRLEDNGGRTSFIQRTIDSTIQVFTGLYPPGQVGAVPNFHRRLTDQENLYPNEDHCESLSHTIPIFLTIAVS